MGKQSAASLAARLKGRLQLKRQTCPDEEPACFHHDVLALVCHYWMDSEVSSRFEQIAAQFLDSGDYFYLVQRHELLACLPLSDATTQAFRLDELLAEAAVVKRLRAGDERHYRGAHFDTIG